MLKSEQEVLDKKVNLCSILRKFLCNCVEKTKKIVKVFVGQEIFIYFPTRLDSFSGWRSQRTPLEHFNHSYKSDFLCKVPSAAGFSDNFLSVRHTFHPKGQDFVP